MPNIHQEGLTLDGQDISVVSPVSVETITVAAVSRFGVKVGDTWYNADRTNPIDLGQFVRGRTYRVSTKTQNGRKVIVNVLRESVSEQLVRVAQSVNRPIQTFTPESVDERQASIVRQVAGKIAGDVVGKILPMYCPTKELVISTFTELYEPLFLKVHNMLRGD